MANNHYLKIVQEIITTEKSYLVQLEKLSIYFSDVIFERKYVAKDVHSVIFGQLSTIYQINCKLYEELSSGKETVGCSFLKLGPFLKVYSSYANNFQRSLSLLQEWLTKNNEFKEFINATETRPEVQSKITSLLITPIQRIPRYKLLLEELMKFTDPNEQIYKDIAGALLKVSDAADHINKSVDDAEALQRLLTIQKALRNQQPNIIVPGRKLIKDGVLNKVSRKGKGSQARMFFLFSDIILYTKIPLQPLNSSSKSNISVIPEVELKPNSLECCCILPLRYCKVTIVLGSSEHGITFRLQCSDEDLLLYSHSSSEGKKWVSAIEETANLALQKRKTLRKASSNRKAIRRTDLKKFQLSDDENTPSPKKTPKSKESVLKKGPSPFTRFQKTEFLKTRLLQAKDCLTPPKTWLTTPRRRKEKEVCSAAVVTPVSATGSYFSSLISSNKTDNFDAPQRFVSRRMSTKNSPRVTSPLAVCSSPNDANMDIPLVFNDYGNKPSFTLRNKLKEQHANLLSPSPSKLDSASVKPKKRPLSDFLSPNYFRHKRRKKNE